jgi:FkbM family methyltransferase
LKRREDTIDAHINYLREYLRNSNISLEVREQTANKLLEMSFSARGYNNYESFTASGEKFFFENLLQKINPQISLDVGANIGGYTEALLESTQSIVYAFEPLDEPYKSMISLFSNYGERFKAVNKGVGDKNEFLEIFYNSEVTPHASFSAEIQTIPYLSNSQKKVVEIVTLDSYFEFMSPSIQRIDFLKVDTEGFEFEVLTGAQKLIALHRPKAIQLEFNWHQLFRGHSINSFSQVLPGYSVFQMHPEALIPRDPKDPYSNIFLFSNFLFVNNDYKSLV